MRLTGTGQRGEWELLAHDYRVSVWDEQKVVEMHSAYGCIICSMYLLPPNFTVKNG